MKSAGMGTRGPRGAVIPVQLVEARLIIDNGTNLFNSFNIRIVVP